MKLLLKNKPRRGRVPYAHLCLRSVPANLSLRERERGRSASSTLLCCRLAQRFPTRGVRATDKPHTVLLKAGETKASHCQEAIDSWFSFCRPSLRVTIASPVTSRLWRKLCCSLAIPRQRCRVDTRTGGVGVVHASVMDAYGTAGRAHVSLKPRDAARPLSHELQLGGG